MQEEASCAIPLAGGKQLDLNNGGWHTVAPSGIPFMPGEREPQQLDKEGIAIVVSNFRKSCGRALTADLRSLNS